jgi:predicted GNAT family acetyltransferase
MPEIRILKPGDEAALEAFLLPRIESSMFLLSNLRHAGLVDRGGVFEGTYAAVLEQGTMAGVVAHYWNGNLVLQAAPQLRALCRAALTASGRSLRGVIGPEKQAAAVVEAFGLETGTARLNESEYLYRLALADLKVPAALTAGQVRGRRIDQCDVAVLTEWRVHLSVESLGDEETPKLWEACRESVERGLERGWIWILEEDGRPVATSAYNAATGGVVQIGGVWTPRDLRRRGYGRSAVAASLLDGRRKGADTAILFTGKGNVPAQKVYEALGFERIGEYRLLLLGGPVDVVGDDRQGARPGIRGREGPER